MADSPLPASNAPAPKRVRAFQPAHALAWSETLADGEALSAPTLALWLPEGLTVAVGLAQKPERELDVEACRRDGVGLVRRHSGGGAVLLYPGVLCWEAVAPLETLVNEDGKPADIRQCYTLLCAPVVKGLAGLGVRVFQAGVSDLSVLLKADGSTRKIAGTAQLRRRRNVLVHGSLLVDADISQIGRYLAFPSAQPEYRRDRSHADFCVAVSEVASENAGAAGRLIDAVAASIAEAAAGSGWSVVELPETLAPEAEARRRDKYMRDDWNWRKTRLSG